MVKRTSLRQILRAKLTWIDKVNTEYKTKERSKKKMMKIRVKRFTTKTIQTRWKSKDALHHLMTRTKEKSIRMTMKSLRLINRSKR